MVSVIKLSKAGLSSKLIPVLAWRKLLLILILCILVLTKIEAQIKNENTEDKKLLTQSYSLSISPLLSISSISKNSGNAHLSSELGKGVLIGYYYNFILKKNYLSIGIMTGFSTMQFSFDLSEDKYNLPWSYFDYHSEYSGFITIPLKFGFNIYSNDKIDIYSYSGININSLLHWDNTFDYNMSGINNNNIKVLSVNYKTDILPKAGVEFAFGIKKKLNNSNFLFINLFFHTSLSSQLEAYYTFFPENEYISTGILKYSNTFTGINIGYEFVKK